MANSIAKNICSNIARCGQNVNQWKNALQKFSTPTKMRTATKCEYQRANVEEARSSKKSHNLFRTVTCPPWKKKTDLRCELLLLKTDEMDILPGLGDLLLPKKRGDSQPLEAMFECINSTFRKMAYCFRSMASSFANRDAKDISSSEWTNLEAFGDVMGLQGALSSRGSRPSSAGKFTSMSRDFSEHQKPTDPRCEPRLRPSAEHTSWSASAPIHWQKGCAKWAR